MRTLDAVISAEMAGLERLLWEGVFWGGTEQQIVGYGSMTQSRPKAPDVDWFLIGLAQQKRHVSVYVNAVKAGKYLLAGVGASLGQVKVGSAAITVPRLDALDQAAFRRLIVEARSLTPDVR